MSLKLRHHLGVSGSLDGARDPQLRRGEKIFWFSLTEFASEDVLDLPTCSFKETTLFSPLLRSIGIISRPSL